MDNTNTTMGFEDPPIITLGDDLHGILGMNSTDSSIFTDILLRNKDKKDELEDEIKDILNEATETFQSAGNIFTDTKIDPEKKDILIPKKTFLSEEIGSFEGKLVFMETKDISDQTPETIQTDLLGQETTFSSEEIGPIEGKILFSEAKDLLVHTTEIIQPDLIIDTSLERPPDVIFASPHEEPREPSTLATEYETLARSVLVSTPAPSSDDSKKFSCSICWKRFPDRRYLNRHFSKHTNRFTCPHCQKSFSRKESQMKHIPNCKIINPEPKKREIRNICAEPRFACKECSQQFTRKENYHQHMFKHQGIRVLCHECQKTLSSWKSFLSHRKTHQYTRTVYFCNHCAAVFLFKSNLRRHLRRAQRAQNTITCNACNLRVKNQATLDRHKSQSIKQCVVCFQTFCLENDLRKHRKILHPEIWFKCKLCDAGIVFTARSEHNLLDHVRKTHKVSLTFMNCYEDEWYVKCD